MNRFGGDGVTRDDVLPMLLWRLGGVGLMAVLGVSVLGVAPGGPEWIAPRHVSAAMLLLAGALFVGDFVRSEQSIFDADFVPYRFSVQLLFFVVLLVVLSNSETAGYGLVFGRTGSAIAVFLILMGFCVLAGDPREYSILQWVVIGCIAIILAIFFYHALSISFWSGQARFPFWYGSILAIGLVVIPQYLTRAQFLWAVNRFTAVLVLLALPLYVIGEYSQFGLQFRFHGAYTIPLVGYEVRATRSLFVNRNAFAVMVFGGFVSSIGELFRGFELKRPGWALIVPAMLVVVNGVGLAVSYGRALWVITPIAIGVYLAYVAFGRRAVPVAVVGGFVYLVSGIAAVHTGFLLLPEDTPTRAARWYPAAAAILDQPSMLGAGFVDPGAFIAPYQGGAEWSPHNSYLTMAIQGGLLGGAAYVLLVGSSLLSGLLELREGATIASVASIALGCGYAAHQQFEAYTLFNWNSSTVLAVLVFGFLVFGGLYRREQTGIDVPASNTKSSE